jgi:hypothetical protein
LKNLGTVCKCCFIDVRTAMTQRKYLACFMAVIALLLFLTACDPLKPLLSEDEVLAWLSERYETDFVIVETIKDCDFPQKDSIIRCRAYQAAPAEDLERTFWVHSTLGKYWGGDSLPMRYSQGVTDTYAFDYFLERFDALLTEHELDHCFRGYTTGRDAIEVSEYLATRHLQGGSFEIRLSKETAEDVVSKVFEILGQVAEEPPLSNYLNYFSRPNYMPISLKIEFCDENDSLADEEDAVDLPYFFPYEKTYDKEDNIIFRDNAESILEDIYEMIYGHKYR